MNANESNSLLIFVCVCVCVRAFFLAGIFFLVGSDILAPQKNFLENETAPVFKFHGSI